MPHWVLSLGRAGHELLAFCSCPLSPSSSSLSLDRVKGTAGQRRLWPEISSSKMSLQKKEKVGEERRVRDGEKDV